MKKYSQTINGDLYNDEIVVQMADILCCSLYSLDSSSLKKIMWALKLLRINHSNIYDLVFEIVKQQNTLDSFLSWKTVGDEHVGLDVSSLIFTALQMISLNKIDIGRQLIEFYHHDIELLPHVTDFTDIVNFLFWLTLLQDYDYDKWDQLLTNMEVELKKKDGQYSKNSTAYNLHIISILTKNEAPSIYERYSSTINFEGAGLKEFISNNTKNSQNYVSVSENQSEIVRVIETLLSPENKPLTCRSEFEINDIKFDIFIPETGTIIEFDGPSHYLNNSKVTWGSSIYKNRLIYPYKNYVTIPFWIMVNEDEEGRRKKNFSIIKEHLQSVLLTIQ